MRRSRIFRSATGLSLVLAHSAWAEAPLRTADPPLAASVLIVLGVALVLAELAAGSGLLAVTGGLAISAGLLLWWVPGLEVPLAVLLPSALLLAAAAVFLVVKARRSQRLPPKVGDHGMVGEVGRALESINDRHGVVLVHGERWDATSRQPIASSASVRVRALHGLTLEVEEVAT